MTNLIQRRERDSSVGSATHDLLGLMLNGKAGSAGNQGNTNIIEEFKTFFLAGTQKTSNMLTWTMVLLAIHQDWQEMARKEVLEVCGKNIPDGNAMGTLKIVSHFSLHYTYHIISFFNYTISLNFCSFMFYKRYIWMNVIHPIHLDCIVYLTSHPLNKFVNYFVTAKLKLYRDYIELVFSVTRYCARLLRG